MGQFESGKWIVAISLYFFVLFLCVYCIVSAANEEGIDTGTLYFNDPGFVSTGNDPSSVTGTCQGTNIPQCSNTFASDASCEQIPGCTWMNSTMVCYGWHGISCSDIESNASLIPVNFTKQEFCQMLRCTYLDATGLEVPIVTVDPNEQYSMGSVSQTIAVITGIGYNSANLGMPASWAFVGQFLIFWIPFFMLLWAIYMALPFVH